MTSLYVGGDVSPIVSLMCLVGRAPDIFLVDVVLGTSVGMTSLYDGGASLSVLFGVAPRDGVLDSLVILISGGSTRVTSLYEGGEILSIGLCESGGSTLDVSAILLWSNLLLTS